MNQTAGRFFFLFLFLGFLQQEHSYAQETVLPGVSLYGKLKDKQTNEAIPYAPVTLINLADSTKLTGTLTDEHGEFLLEQIQSGLWKIKVKYIGYQLFRVDSIRIGKSHSVNLGVIFLSPGEKELKTVEVVSKESNFRQVIDKKVFNVEADLASKGGSATDVLKNIPSVSVDVDGNVSLRGSGNITVLIDGRPSGIIVSSRSAILDQIPASSIESIELITNPSAKYDPDGVSGIINIVLKKNTARGLSGTVSVMYSTLIKGNAGLTLGYKKKKLNLFGSYSYRYNEKWYSGYTNRTNFLTGNQFSTDQTSAGIRHIQTHMGKIGMDYALNSKNTISASCLYNHDLDLDVDTVGYQFVNKYQQLTSYSHRTMYGNDLDQGYDASLSFLHKFEQPEKRLYVEVSASGNSNQVNDSIGQRDFYPNNVPIAPTPTIQRIINKYVLGNYFAKTDFSTPLGETSNLESGLKYSNTTVSNDFRSFSYNTPQATWQEDSSISNVFGFREQIYSAYAICSKKMKRLEGQIGGRLEEDQRHARLEQTGQEYQKQYLNFFPSAHLGYIPGEEQEFRLSYSRRINRPGLRNLNPFPDYTDPLNLRYGNPDLNPEYIDALELSWLRYLPKGSLSASLYYRHTNGVIQLYRVLSDTVMGATSSTWKNLNFSDTYGGEATLNKELFPWWGLTANVNAYQLNINGTNIDPTLHNEGFTWFSKVNSRFYIFKNLLFQCSGVYYAPAPTSQGVVKEMYSVDAGLHLDFLQGKGGLSLGVNDVFNTLHSQVETYTPEFNQYFYKKRESRIATLSLSIRFGSGEKLRKKKTTEEVTPPPPQPETE